MNLLLDTNEFIWAAEEPNKLTKKVADALRDKSNIWYLSVASIWEMQIKVQIRKLTFKQPLRRIIFKQKRQNDLRILPVKPKHIFALENLPFHHKDPFDRLIIAQATIENFTLVSADSAFSTYSVNILS